VAGGTYPIWSGQSAEKFSLEATVFQKQNTDIRPILTALKGAVGLGQSWLFVWGVRTIGPVAVVSVEVTETHWLGGTPTTATVSIELVKVGILPTISSKVSGLTAAEKKAGLTAAAKALGLAEDKLTIDSDGKVKQGTKEVGQYTNGKFKKVA